MKRSSVFYWLIGTVIVVIAVAASFYFDGAVRDFMAQHQDRGMRRFMLNVSRIGDWPAHLAIGLMLMTIAWLRGNKRWTRVFLSMLIALALAGVVGRGIKIATGRARPSVKTEEAWNRLSTHYHAFPSGHVAASMGFFGVLFFVRRRVALACLPIPILIGISRMYVSAHYLSDVICAALLGILCAFLVARVLLHQIENRRSTIEN